MRRGRVFGKDEMDSDLPPFKKWEDQIQIQEK